MFKVLLAIALLSLYSAIEAAKPDLDVQLTADSTTIQEGQSTKMTCNLNNFQPPDDDQFEVFFESDRRTIGFFLSLPGPSGNRPANFVNMPYRDYEAFGEANNGTSFVVRLVPRNTKATGEYSCRFQNGKVQAISNHIHLTTQ